MCVNLGWTSLTTLFKKSARVLATCSGVPVLARIETRVSRLGAPAPLYSDEVDSSTLTFAASGAEAGPNPRTQKVARLFCASAPPPAAPMPLGRLTKST